VSGSSSNSDDVEVDGGGPIIDQPWMDGWMAPSMYVCMVP